MPLSDRRSDDAWDNLRRQPHMTDLEDALLGVMAEAQAAGTLPGSAPAESQPEVRPSTPKKPETFDLRPLAGLGSDTIEGARSDLFTLDEFSDLNLAIDGDLFAVFGLQLNKDHVVALLRVYNAFQAAEDDDEITALGQTLWTFLDFMLEHLYEALKGTGRA